VIKIKILHIFSLPFFAGFDTLSSQIQLVTIRGQSAATRVINSFSLPFFAGFGTLFSNPARNHTRSIGRDKGNKLILSPLLRWVSTLFAAQLKYNRGLAVISIKAHSLSPSSLDLKLSSQIQQSKSAP
jgi:hypothetical protein